MIFCFAKAHGEMPPLHDIELAVKRNFDGLEDIKPWDFFKDNLLKHVIS